MFFKLKIMFFNLKQMFFNLKQIFYLETNILIKNNVFEAKNARF